MNLLPRAVAEVLLTESATGRLHAEKLRDHQIKALETIRRWDHLLILEDTGSRQRASMSFDKRCINPCLVTRPNHLGLEPNTWLYDSATYPNFNKRTRNKFLGIDRPTQVVNSNKYTKKKAKRKTK